MSGLGVFLMLVGAALYAAWRGVRGDPWDVAERTARTFLLIVAIEGWGMFAWSRFEREVRFERLLEVAHSVAKSAERAGVQIDSADAEVLRHVPPSDEPEPAVRFNAQPRGE
jgi:hypothetical protein